ncbi:helix-turn-helix domain-containing protein [Pseudomonas sp.]|uniref:helix-turn-helix domain-containing protein n=1 Tax=Pseudomonas sp. TaxID=306 RepID=UPI003C728B21
MTTHPLSLSPSNPTKTQVYNVVSARFMKQKSNQTYSSKTGQLIILIFLSENGILTLKEPEAPFEVEIRCGTCIVLGGAEIEKIAAWDHSNDFVEIMIDHHFLSSSIESLKLDFASLKKIVAHYGPEFGFDCVARRMANKIGEGITSYASLIRSGVHCPAAARFILAMVLKSGKTTEAEFDISRRKLQLPEPRFNKVADYIGERISSAIHVGELASIAAQSHFHFTRTFKARTGQSPHAYVLEHRIRRAERLLAETSISLSQISQDCGFSSQSHFTTAFKQHIGLTPGHYRCLWLN